MKTTIIYEDKYIMVVRKPVGLATESASVGQPDVVSELKNYIKTKGSGVPYLGVIHRLDQPVEGLIVFAKDKNSAAGLSKQLQENTLKKRYYAVACGKPEADQATLVDYLVKNGSMAQVVDDPKGSTGRSEAKRAELTYRLAGVYLPEDGMPLSLLDVSIQTGRFHQIRVQMSHAGLPLLGDLKYGTEDSVLLANQMGVRGLGLCAYGLSLTHPKTGEKLEFQVKPEGQPFSFFSFDEKTKE